MPAWSTIDGSIYDKYFMQTKMYVRELVMSHK